MFSQRLAATPNLCPVRRRTNEISTSMEHRHNRPRTSQHVALYLRHIAAGALSGPAVLAAASTARAANDRSPHTCVLGEFEVLSGQEARALQLMQTMTEAVRREPRAADVSSSRPRL